MVVPGGIHGVATAMCFLSHGLCNSDVAALYSSEAPRSLLLPFGIVFFSNCLLVGLILNDDNFWYLNIHKLAVHGENIRGPWLSFHLVNNSPFVESGTSLLCQTIIWQIQLTDDKFEIFRFKNKIKWCILGQYQLSVSYANSELCITKSPLFYILSVFLLLPLEE